MPNGSPEVPGVPPEKLGPFAPEKASEEELASRQRAEMAHVSEVIRDPDVTPELARELLVHELLFPAEKGRLEISRWDINPTLRELSRRSGEKEEVRRLTGILERQTDNLSNVSALVERMKEQGGDEQERKRLEAKVEYLQRTRKKTERIIEIRMRSSLFDDESREWWKLYREVEGTVSWHEIYLQRVKAMPDVDTYADSLFKSNFYIAIAETSYMVALLEQKDYGPAIEKALRAYVDLHLKGELGGQKVSDKFKLLQGESSTENEREKVYKAVRSVVDPDPFVAERAEILARHLFETSLLSVWLAVPRNSEGKVIYNQEGKWQLPKTGSKRLEGASPNDLDKLVLFRLKYWSELNKNYPSAAGGMGKYLPESLTPTFFHFMKFEDEEGGKKVSKSAFDEWYFRGRPLVELLKKVSEDAFSSWTYIMWRQNHVREHLLNFSRGGREDCIVQLFMPGSVRPMKKDFDLGISNPLERLTAKINLIGCRIYAFENGSSHGGEVTSTSREAGWIEQKDATRSVIKETISYVGFLPKDAWPAVQQIISSGVALTPKDIVRIIPREILRGILAEKPTTRRLEEISKVDLQKELAEVKRADDLVKHISERIRRKEELDSILGTLPTT